jgi:hypothetical protein
MCSFPINNTNYYAIVTHTRYLSVCCHWYEQLMHALFCAVLITTLEVIRLSEHYQTGLYALPLLFVLFMRLLSLCDLRYVHLVHNIKCSPIIY